MDGVSMTNRREGPRMSQTDTVTTTKKHERAVGSLTKVPIEMTHPAEVEFDGRGSDLACPEPSMRGPCLRK